MPRFHWFVAAFVAVLVAPPAYGQVTRDPQTATVSDGTVRAGQTITVEGDGWEPGSRITITGDDGRQLGVTTAGDGGRFAAKVRVPGDLPEGPYPLTVSGEDAEGGQFSLSVGLEVSEQVGRFRGWPWVLAGVALAVVVLVLLGWGAIRRSRVTREPAEETTRATPEPRRSR